MAPLHPLPTIAGTVRCQFGGALQSGKRWSNVVHCKFTGAAGQPSDADLATLDTKLVRLWSGANYTGGTAYLAACPNTTTLDRATYYVLDGVSPATIVTRNVLGTQPAGTTPSEVAIVLTLRTAKRGRRYRGRIYLPAPATTQMAANGQLQSASVTLVLAQFDGLVTDLGSANWQIGVATYGHSTDKHGVTTNWTPEFTPVAAGIRGRSMDGIADVQRHRKG